MSATQPELRELFEAALAQPAAARSDWLARHCSDPDRRATILRMLAADGAGEESRLLDTPVDQLFARVGDSAAERPLPGTRVGPFTLVDTLGEGGSSIVFRATREQAGVRQTVALKLLRRGLFTPEEHRRFRAERRALAQLRHPGIAHLVEGGITEAGVPYIALELVDGSPITDHARDHGLDLRQRLELFVQACRAVEAAHRALIVHRDLKPSNVLVTHDGIVKLLDFGIAKLLEPDADTQATRTQHAAMTPAYAAPEQFRGGPITTATDVYALGVLLGELLTGHRRCQGDARTPSAQVDATTGPGVLPAPPARIRRQLRGDLDNIVLMATAEEPERRYASAGAFAEDIVRHLGAQPVSAHPPSAWYRTRKFVTRHRGGAMTTAAFVLAVFAALGIALWQADRAGQAAQRANAMRDFMVSAFAEAQPSVPREGAPRVTEVVEQAIANARADTAMNPGVRIELVSQLGEVLRGQGRLTQAKDILQWNLESARRAFGDSSPLALEAAHQLGATLVLTGEFDAARPLLDAALARVRTRGALAANLHFDSALLASKQHALQRAVADADAGMRIARETGDTDVLARALAEQGNVQLEIDDIPGATASFEELLALRVQRFGPSHVSVAATHADLSRAYRRAGKTADAERHIRAALEIDAAVLPVDDWRHANHLNALTMVLLAQRDYPAALDAARETLRINRVVNGEDHPETANDLNSVGMLHAQLEQWPAALVPLRDSLARCEAKYGPDHYETAVVRANYGVVLARTGDVAGGESEVLRALASLEADPEPDLDEQAATLEKLVRLRLARGEPDTVATLVARIDALLARMRAPGAYWEGRSAILHATALLQSNQPAQATGLLDSAAAALKRSPHPDPVLGVEVALLQASASRAVGDIAAAERHAHEGVAALATLRHPPGRITDLAKSLHPTAPSPATAP